MRVTADVTHGIIPVRSGSHDMGGTRGLRITMAGFLEWGSMTGEDM